MTPTILRCEDPDELDGLSALMTVSHGLADASVKAAFLESVQADPDCINFTHSDTTYELWQENKLIGVCNWDLNLFDAQTYCDELSDAALARETLEANKNTLFVRGYLHDVILLPESRGQGLATYFAGVLREILSKQLFAKLVFAETAFDCVDFYSDAEYHSEGGERFHLEIHADLPQYIKHVVENKFEAEFSFEVDGGY